MYKTECLGRPNMSSIGYIQFEQNNFCDELMDRIWWQKSFGFSYKVEFVFQYFCWKISRNMLMLDMKNVFWTTK